MAEVAVDGTQFSFERAGELGDPLVIVHGGFEDRRAWEGVLRALSSGLQVLSYDRRGHGSTAGPPRQRPLDEDVRDLARLLETLDLYPVHLASHGSSSSVVLRLALERPELVRSLLLHEPTVLTALSPSPASDSTRERLLATLRGSGRSARNGHAAEAAASYLSAFGAPTESWDRLDAASREIWLANAPAWGEELDDAGYLAPDPASWAELVLPVLLSRGERSPPSATELAHGVAAHLRGATLVEIPDAGHLPHRLAPWSLSALWASFLLERNVPPS